MNYKQHIKVKDPNDVTRGEDSMSLETLYQEFKKRMEKESVDSGKKEEQCNI